MSYNGVDTRMYKDGQVYTAQGGFEARAFQHCIERGYAEIYDPAVTRQTKVTPPPHTKAVQASQTPKPKRRRKAKAKAK